MSTQHTARVLSRPRFGPSSWPPVRLLSFAALSGVLALAGCGVGNQIALNSDEVVLPPIEGHVHGGAYPIQYATVRLWETGNTTALGSTSTDKYGNFTFTTVSNCSTGTDQIYATVNGGGTQSSGAQNPYLVQVGVIGACSNLTSNATVKLWLSELSTVATAFALRNFITTDSSNDVYISANSDNLATTPACSSASCSANGLSHAFTLAAQLVDSVHTDGTQPTGAAFANIGSNTNSVLPNAMINTIGDILQQCVDSAGTTTSNGTTSPTSQCSSLLTNTTINGTAPTSTLGAAINMAKYPTQNVGALLAQIAPQTPFTPYLCSTSTSSCNAPSSFAMPVYYGVNVNSCLQGSCSSQVPYPVDISIDINDDVYVLYAGASSNSSYMAVGCVDPIGGSFIQGTNWTPTTSTYAYPAQLALDLSGHVLVTNDDPTTPDGGVLGAFTSCSSSNPIALTALAQLPYAYGIASDRSNNFWVTTALSASGQIVEYAPTSYTSIGVATLSKTFAFPLYAVALDSAQNVWAQGTTSTRGYAAELAYNTSAGNYGTSGSAGYSTAFSNGYGGASLALSSASLAYFPMGSYLNTAKSTGATTAPTVAQASSGTGSTTPGRSQFDKASTLYWADTAAGGYLYKYNTSATSPVATAVSPCLAYATSTTVYSCLSDGSLVFRTTALDSMGNLWTGVTAPYGNAAEGAVMELVGFGSPSWPLAYGYPGTGP